MRYRVNWKIEDYYTDNLIRVHRVFPTNPKACGFDKMKEYSEFETEEEAEKAIKEKGIKKYRHCEFCWDGMVKNV